MLDAMGRNRFSLVLAVALAPAAVGCSNGHDSREQEVFAAPCLWTVDELLAEVGAPVEPARIDCGTTNAAFEAEVTQMQQCFERAATDPGAEYTVNVCVDCAIEYTQVSSPDGEYQIFREDDVFGDADREVSVSRCDSFGPEPLDCAGTRTLLSCTGPRWP
jgi:hypothetical protein